MATGVRARGGFTAAWPRIWPWLGIGGRLLLGGVWLAAGALKIPDPAESVRAVRAYRLLPELVVPTVGYGLPILEVAIGVLLIVGIAVRVSGIISAGLLVVYIVGIASAWARGLQIDCGCFGGGGDIAGADTRYPQEIARDAGLLLIAIALAWWPRTRLALSSAFAYDAGPDLDEYADDVARGDQTDE